MSTTRDQSIMLQQIFLSIVLLLFAPSLSAVLGIDFGADRIKVAAVVPGRSFDIVLDEASKRSHPNLVVFDDDVRQYGTSASSLVIYNLHSIFYNLWDCEYSITHHIQSQMYIYIKYILGDKASITIILTILKTFG